MGSDGGREKSGESESRKKGKLEGEGGDAWANLYSRDGRDLGEDVKTCTYTEILDLEGFGFWQQFEPKEISEEVERERRIEREERRDETNPSFPSS